VRRTAGVPTVGTARRHPTADESVLIGGVGTKHGQVEKHLR
jgi:hypothetical protein